MVFVLLRHKTAIHDGNGPAPSSHKTRAAKTRANVGRGYQAVPAVLRRDQIDRSMLPF